MKTISGLILSFALLGCASTKTVVGPDGTEHLLVSCSAIGHCYEKAREACDGKYTIVNTSDDVSSGYSHPELLVKCAKTGAAKP